MTEWNQIGAALGGLDAGDPCHRQGIALGQGPVGDPVEGSGCGDEVRLGDRLAGKGGFPETSTILALPWSS